MASSGAPLAIDRAGLDEAFSAPERRGCALVAPLVRDQAGVFEELYSIPELPVRWTDAHEAVDEMSGELQARLAIPTAGRRADPDAARPPSL